MDKKGYLARAQFRYDKEQGCYLPALLNLYHSTFPRIPSYESTSVIPFVPSCLCVRGISVLH